MKNTVYLWVACCLAAAMGARSASASEFQITADSFTVANQLNVSSATFYQARLTPPPDPASASQLTTPGGLYFDGTYYNVWDRNALAWVRLSTGAGSGSVAATDVTAGTLGPAVITSSVAASVVGSTQVADNSLRHVDMARGADTAVAGSASDVALGLNADLLDGLDSSGFAAASSGVCYTSWAGSSCAAGWTAVVTGRMLHNTVQLSGQIAAGAGPLICARTDGDLFGNGRSLSYGAFNAELTVPGGGEGGTARRAVVPQSSPPDTTISGAISCAICCK